MNSAYTHNITGKSSSRILQPPGGHSDIFGLHEKRNEDNKVVQSPPTASKEITKPEGATKNGTHEQNGVEQNKRCESEKPANADENNESKIEEKTKPAPPQRVRVPPGGFSSKLW